MGDFFADAMCQSPEIDRVALMVNFRVPVIPESIKYIIIYVFMIKSLR